MRSTKRGCSIALVLLALALAPEVARAGILAPCPVFPGPGDPIVECFDELVSGSAASAATFDGMSVIDGLVLSESDASFLLGMDTTGWATSGAQGVLNALVPVVEFLFDETIKLFRADVLVLPGPFGVPVPVVLQGFLGDTLVSTTISDVSMVRPDGTQAQPLTVTTLELAFDRVLVFAAAAPCAGPDCEVGGTTSFFLDTLKYIPGGPKSVPEPGGMALALAGLLGLAAAGRAPRREGGIR